MRRKVLVVVVAACAALTSVVPPASAARRDVLARTRLTGAAERPGPGDPDGFGAAVIVIDHEADELCVRLSWRNVDGTYSGLHIHLAPPTSAGPIVVPFATPPTPSNRTAQCVEVGNEALLTDIAANPGKYYINLHSQPNFGPGAIRGQLRR